MKVKKETLFPKTKIQWLWENMKGRRVLYVIGMLGTVVYNILQLTVPYYSGRIVDLFLSGADAWKNMRTNSGLFYHLLILMIVFTVLRGVIVYGDCMIYEHVSQTVLYRVRNFLYDKIQRQDMTFYSTYRTGDLMTRVTGDLDAVRHMVAWVIRMVIESFSLFGVVAIYFFYMNWKMALSLLIISPFVFFIIYLFKNKVAPMHAKLREKLAQMNTYAQENISGNRVVKAFAREAYEIEKFDRANKDYAETNKETSMVWLKFFPYVESIANLMPVVMLAVGGVFLIRGELTMGDYVAFSGLIWAIANPMRQMGNIMNEFQRFSAASKKVMEIYYSEPQIKDALDAAAHTDHFKGKIEFREVSFQYEDGDLPVLHDISFTVKPGETIAIMGETGCGKTSLINLIPPLILIFGVLGSIFGGIATPTEAAGIGALFSLILAIFYKQFSWKMLYDSLIDTAKTSAMVFIILFGASAFTGIFMSLDGDQLIATWISSVGIGKWGAFAIMMAIVFFMGMFLDWLGIVMIVFPIF